jgi:uncharacterized membrane protein YqiK
MCVLWGMPLPSARVVVAVLVPAAACTVVALLAFFALIAEAGPQRALVVTSGSSTVALALGMPYWASRSRAQLSSEGLRAARGSAAGERPRGGRA